MTRRYAAPLAFMLTLAVAPMLRAQQSAPAAPQSAAKPAASIDGTWNMSIATQQGMQATAVFKSDAKKVTGSVTNAQGETPLAGEFADGKLTFSISYATNNGPIPIAFSGALKDDGTLAGTMNYGQGDIAWTATRQKEQKDKTDAKPIDVAGKWSMTLEMANGTGSPTLTLKQDGEKIGGTYAGRYGEFPLTGTLKGNAIEFAFTMTAEGTDVDMTFEGEVAADGQSIKGSAVLGPLGDASWTAKRAK
jgi:hypothetical protein